MAGRNALELRGGLSVGAVLAGAALGFGITFLGSVFMGFAVAITPWEGFDVDLHWFSYVCIGIGGVLAAKRSRRGGLFHGGMVGLVYFAAAALLFRPDFDWSDLIGTAALIKAAWSVAAGAAGGIVGVNI